MLSYSESYAIVEQKLKEMAFSRMPDQLYSPITYILSIGGKRIRPCLTLMAHSLFSNDQSEILNAAMGIEVFHNFTLLHDDIMDKASVRRSYPTVHKKWNENVAILSGDAMLILAYQLVAKCRPEILPEMLNLFNKTALEVCEGQQFDMNFETQKQVSVSEYLEMIRLKTAVLLAASLAVGGIASSADKADIDALYHFGLNLGMAFQLQDDYLDVFAKNEKFGKANGGDIVSNKKTYLMLKALEQADSLLKKELVHWLEKNTFDEVEKIQAVKSIFTQLQIGEQTLECSDSYFKVARQYLDKISVPAENKLELEAIVNTMIKREH